MPDLAGDAGAGPVEGVVVEVDEHDRQAVSGDHGGDPGAHHARADDGQLIVDQIGAHRTSE